jgi:hypothetical protein
VIFLLKILNLRRIAIGAGIVLVLLGIYAALGFWGVPYAIRTELPKVVKEDYGRTLSLGEVKFNPFTLTLEARDLSFPDTDGKPMLALQRLLIQLQFASLWRLGPSFDQIILEQPFARVLIRRNGSLNLADLSKPFEKPQPPAKKTAPLRLYIDRFALISGHLAFEDLSRPVPFSNELRPLNLELRDFNTTGTGRDAYALSASTPRVERLQWRGTVSLTPLGSRGHFELVGLRAGTIWSYLRGTLPFEFSSGQSDFTGDYEFTASGPKPQLTIAVHQVAVHDLGVKPSGSTESDYVHIPQLTVGETKFDLRQQTVSVGPIRASRGVVRAWRDASGAINLLALMPKATSDAAASAPPGGTAPAAGGATPASSTTAASTGAGAHGAPATSVWKISVPDIGFEGWQVSAEDRTVNPAAVLRLEGLDAHVGGYTTTPGSNLEVTASTRVNDTGKLRARATLAASGAVQGQVQADELDLTALQPYVAQYTALNLLSGRLATRLELQHGADGLLVVTGDTSVTKLRTVDDALRKDFVKWDRLALEGIAYRSSPAQLKIHTVTAQAPYGRFIVASNRTLNIAEAFGPAGAASRATPAPTKSAAPTAPPEAAPSETPAPQSVPPQTPTPQSAPPEPPAKAAPPTSKSKRHGTAGAAAKANASTAPPAIAISVDSVRIVDGSANYTDLWIQPNFSIGIQGLAGTIDGLSSDPRSRAKVELNGKVDRYAPAHIWGEVNLLAATSYTDLKMTFKGVELSSVTPYSGRFAGYKIEKGKLSIDLAYHIEERQLKADHHFVIDQLQLGEKVESPDAVKLPVKLAVALLKDRNGVIDVGLPITGTLDDPKFRVGPIIWKAVVNLLVKAATAPFALLGHLFGGGQEHMDLIDFDPGSATLDKSGQDKLAGVLKSLQERPQLQLDVPAVVSPTLDRPLLATHELHKELITQAQADPPSSKHAPPPAADESALADPQVHYRLLLAKYRTDMGADAALPESAQAIEANKKAKPPLPLEPAIADLETALKARVTVSDSDLEKLGKRRAQAIQDVLLGGGAIDPARVFVIASPKDDPAAEGKVRAQLALK